MPALAPQNTVRDKLEKGVVTSVGRKGILSGDMPLGFLFRLVIGLRLICCVRGKFGQKEQTNPKYCEIYAKRASKPTCWAGQPPPLYEAGVKAILKPKLNTNMSTMLQDAAESRKEKLAALKKRKALHDNSAAANEDGTK